MMPIKKTFRHDYDCFLIQTFRHSPYRKKNMQRSFAMMVCWFLKYTCMFVTNQVIVISNIDLSMEFSTSFKIPLCLKVIRHPTLSWVVVICKLLDTCIVSYYYSDVISGVSNHRCLDCLPKRLFRRRSKKTSTLHVTALSERIHWWLVNSPHKGQ